MAYFDSAKNRALWEKEMAGLRKERARRAEIIKNGGSLEPEKEQPVEIVEETKVMRERTSYAQLLKEEMQANNTKKPIGKTKAMTKSLDHQKDMVKNGPQLSGI